MKLNKIIKCTTLAVASAGMVNAAEDHLVLEAKGESNGKHVVLIAGDEEYRSEESMPMMAHVLSNNGFKCTVLFSMDKQNKFVDPLNLTVSGRNTLSTQRLILVGRRVSVDKFSVKLG